MLFHVENSRLTNMLHREEPHTKAGVDISRASHFQIHSFNSRMNAEEINDLSPFYAPLGCGDGGARDKAYQFGSLNKKDSSYTDSSTHRKQCMFASITRSLLNPGPGKRLKSEKDWLRSFYVGSSQRFDTVVAVDKRMSNQSASSSGSSTGICTREPVFDVVIHLRTLALIEDLSTDSGEPEDAQGKADRFIASDKFNDMVHCLASQLAAIYRKKSKKSQVAEPVTVYLATDAAMNVRETFAVRLGEAVAEAVSPDRNNWPSARNRLVEGWNRNGDERRRATTNIPFAHSTKHHHSHQHHVDEGNAQLEEQAQRLNESRKRPKVSWSWAVEIDYFTSSLPPAHFMLWTLHNNELTTDIWQRLVGTTAEWLFLSEGSRMLTIKGLKGGEKALPSSFAVSAAAFGRTSEVDYLLSSGKNGAMQCDWRGIGVFT